MAITDGQKEVTKLAIAKALHDLAYSYENGLDVAGAASDAMFFDGIQQDIKGGVDPVDVLLHVLDRYGNRNGNEAVAREFLEAALHAARTNGGLTTG